MRSAYALARCLHIHIPSIQCAGRPTQPSCHECFQMLTWLEREYFLNTARPKYVTVFLEDNLSPPVKIVGLAQCGPETYVAVHSSHFKNHIPKDGFHESGDLRHTLDLFFGRHIGFVGRSSCLLTKWMSQDGLMGLAGLSLNR